MEECKNPFGESLPNPVSCGGQCSDPCGCENGAPITDWLASEGPKFKLKSVGSGGKIIDKITVTYLRTMVLCQPDPNDPHGMGTSFCAVRKYVKQWTNDGAPPEDQNILVQNGPTDWLISAVTPRTYSAIDTIFDGMGIDITPVTSSSSSFDELLLSSNQDKKDLERVLNKMYQEASNVDPCATGTSWVGGDPCN